MMNSTNKQNILKKIKSYIGFAKKSGNIKIGADNIMSCNKSKLILISKSASDNTINKLSNYVKKINSSILIINEKYAEFIFETDKIKAISLLDNNLSNAIKSEFKKLEDTILE